MATRRMLIDATHPEETRVVVLDGNRLEDFDVEVASRRQLKGNIYLAKVTRVEPSLQAAFVEYGGNRHGFLAFNEIHPDYYQIPIADREALIAEQVDQQKADEARGENGGDGSAIDSVGGSDDEEVEVRRPLAAHRHYKIQEVIKRRQILLVQVVKEERGNKGAALTTYLSLAGRYCVLMPNTARGGGISRKITQASDRKRLKSIVGDLDIPEGIAVIVRTAGAQRSKAEIKRDYDYLLRLWSSVREATLQSTAPALVYEEGNLIKRAIRDLYDRDIQEIIVDGDAAYRTAKSFMKLLIPSHAKRVKPYVEEGMPLYQRHGVESNLDAMLQPRVGLRSGGYIIINPTEALVAIDVNSGRATRERNIEETALRTNVEAADEVARQLRLRDLAGLIVIDFIDMENSRNQSQVERRLKEAMKSDRARIQVGRISPFGLLELSRQRLRPSLMETSFQVCPTCRGAGAVRTIESTALHILRVIEEEGLRRRSSEVTVRVPTAVALYVLNNKRAALAAIEARYGFAVSLAGDDTLIPPDHTIERVKAAVETPAEADEEESEDETAVAEASGPSDEDGSGTDDTAKRKRRRRPRKRKRPDDERDAADTAEASDETAESEADDDDDEADDAAQAAGDDNADDDDAPAKRRRRGRRGGRRRTRKTSDRTDEDGTDEEPGPSEKPADETTIIEVPITDGLLSAPEDLPLLASATAPAESEAEGDDPAPTADTADRNEKPAPAPRRRRTTTRTKAAADARPEAPDVIYAPSPGESVPERAGADIVTTTAEATHDLGDNGGTVRTDTPDAVDTPVETDGEEKDVSDTPGEDISRTTVIHVGEEAEPDRKPRRGWWQRLLD